MSLVSLTGELGFLIYISEGVKSFSQSELKVLLETSRRNNAPRGITGMLLYRERRFLQYLEGTPVAVAAAYDHIRSDQRHHSAQTINSGELPKRIFPEWSMGYRNLAGVRAANTPGFTDCLLPNFRPLDEGDAALRFVRLFQDLELVH
jgi:hypothetical protein